MRILYLLLLLMCLAVGKCQAISAVNIETIKEAQQYGKTNSAIEYSNFILPWKVYEENAQVINERTENACLYTPFLLVASDARNRIVNGLQIDLKDSQKIVTEYLGYLIFQVLLYGTTEDFAKDISVSLKQDEHIIKPYSILNNAVEKTSWFPSQPAYLLQLYVYVKENQIITNKPITLSVIANFYNKRNFYFDLGNIR